MVAGDEASYSVFAELFDPVIEGRHNGFKETDIHITDLDFSKIEGTIPGFYVYYLHKLHTS